MQVKIRPALERLSDDPRRDLLPESLMNSQAIQHSANIKKHRRRLNSDMAFWGYHFITDAHYLAVVKRLRFIQMSANWRYGLRILFGIEALLNAC